MNRLVYWLLAVIARGVCLTLRVRCVNAEPLDELRRRHENCVIAFWHGSMIAGWFFHRPKNEEHTAALVSLSKDGAILATVLRQWRFRLIRGSSHIGGKEALQTMVSELDRGSMLCVTPDGPTGPRHVMKAGALLAARRAGVPLVIAGIAVKKKKVLSRSWDKFEIPMPFSEVCIWYDEPMTIPKFLQPASVDASHEEHVAEAVQANSGEGKPSETPVSDETRRAVNDLLESIQARLADIHAKAHRELGIAEV